MGMVRTCSPGHLFVTAADNADGTDANAGGPFGSLPVRFGIVGPQGQITAPIRIIKNHRNQFLMRRSSIRENSRSLSVTTA
jgi:hypothetical protein